MVGTDGGQGREAAGEGEVEEGASDWRYWSSASKKKLSDHRTLLRIQQRSQTGTPAEGRSRDAAGPPDLQAAVVCQESWRAGRSATQQPALRLHPDLLPTLQQKQGTRAARIKPPAHCCERQNQAGSVLSEATPKPVGLKMQSSENAVPNCA